MYDIQLVNVTKVYNGSLPPAVNKMNLEVSKGEFVTLLGPSGCGKTTTLRLISGFEAPDKGEIILAGTEVATTKIWIPPEKRGVGMVFQDYALFPHLTIEENTAFGLKNSPYKNNRTSKIISLVGLKGYEKRYPHELSGGQQQRVALARALAPSPVVILLDEPFSNLDTQLRKYMRQEIRDIIKTEGTTALLVTHDQKEAFEMSDKIAVINNGRVEQVGLPKDIYLNPINEFVANFLGKSNIFNGTIDKSLSINTEVGKITHDCCPVNFPAGIEVKVLIRPNGFKLDTNGEIKGLLKKLVFKGEIMEGIVVIENTKQHKEITVYFDLYDEVKCGDYVTLKVISNSAVIFK